MGGNTLALDHALGDDGAHFRERDHVGGQGLRLRAFWFRLRHLRCGQLRLRRLRNLCATLVDESKDVLLVNAAVGAGTGDVAQVDVVFFSNAADQGRRPYIRMQNCHLRWG